MGNPYEEGQQAYYNGKDLEDNPYAQQTPNYNQWWRGYIDADIEESGETG